MIEFIRSLKEILEILEKKHIKYVITRNYRFIDKNEIYDGKDVDICINKKDVKSTIKILLKHDFKKYPINPFSNHLGFIKYIKNSQKILFIHLHIDGITGKHLKYLDSKHILTHRIKKSFYYVPSIEDEFLIILLHCILDKSSIKQEYRQDLKELFWKIKNQKYISNVLTKIFGQNEIINIIKHNEFNKLENQSKKFKKSFLKKYKNKIYVLIKVYGCGFFWKILWLLKTKPMISFIGMDGAGKTTASIKALNILKQNNISAVRIYTGRGKNNILPIHFFGKQYTKLGGKSSVGKELNGKKQYSLIHSLAAPVFALDLWLRYWLKIFWLRKINHIIITDRYTTDILLTNKVPMWLKKILFMLFPKPTKTIYLYNTPEVLAKRKDDHPIEDLKRQEKIFVIINNIIKPTKIKSVEKDKTIKQVMIEIFKII